jgi:serine protease Do
MKNPKNGQSQVQGKWALFVLSLFMLSSYGCVTIMGRKKQHVRIYATTPGATIYHDGDSVGVNSAKLKLKKRNIFETVTLHKDGFKDKNHVFGLRKYDPVTYSILITSIPPTIFFGPFIDLGNSDTYISLKRYKRKIEVPAQTEIEMRKPEEKFLEINTVMVDAKKDDIIQLNYRSYRKYLNSLDGKKRHKGSMNQIFDNRKTLDSNFKAESEYLTNWLNGSLYKLNFIDTTNTLFKNKSNRFYINVIVKSIQLHEVSISHPDGANGYSRMLVMETKIDWELLNMYKEKITTITTEQRSDPFQYNVLYSNAQKKYFKRTKADAINIAMADNLDYSFLKVRKLLAQQQLLTQNQKTVDTLTPMNIQVGNMNQSNSLNDFIKSSVTVKVDEGHGSGVIISSEGYIVTNYHVIANSKKIEVILNDGTTVEATVVRKNQEGDLALLKINNTGLIALNVGTEKDVEIGADVCALGTPKNIELGQSISKGIVSNIRTKENIHLIQTDAKVSPGNSGGALINNNGLVLGIVSSKLIGKGTEGISFAIYASDMLRLLKINLIK